MSTLSPNYLHSTTSEEINSFREEHGFNCTQEEARKYLMKQKVQYILTQATELSDIIPVLLFLLDEIDTGI